MMEKSVVSAQSHIPSRYSTVQYSTVHHSTAKHPVTHTEQDRARGQRVQEAQQGEVLRRGADSGPVADREDIPEGEM